MKKTKKQNLIYPDTRQRFIDFISFLLSFGVTALVVYLATLLPLGVDFDEVTKNVLPRLLEDCQPEPFEMIQYALTVITMPLAYLFFNNLLSKRWKIKPEKSQYWYNLLQAGMALFVVLLGVSIYLVMYDYFNVPFYTGDGEFYKRFNVKVMGYCFIIEAAILLLIYLVRRLDNKKLEKIAFFTVFLVFTIYCGVSVLRINYIQLNADYNLHHFYAFWYPIYKVFSGKTPGVDFENIYGFYAYLIVPVLKLFGGVCQRSISIYIAILLCYNSACYFIFSYRFINNKILALIVALIGAGYGPFCVLSNAVYFQYYPLRTVFLATAMLGAVIYLRLNGNMQRLVFNLFMYIALGFGIAWNIESGLVAVVFWSAFLAFEKIYENGFDKNAIIYIIKICIGAVLSVLTFLGFVEAMTYSRSGVFIGKDEILFGVFAFEGTGFYMIPFIFGIWVIFAFIYAVTLLISVSYLAKEKRNDLNKTEVLALFLSSVAGIGSFMYFVGRSYPTNIISQSAVFCICCGVLIEYYVKRIKNRSGDTKLSVKSYFKNKNGFDTVKLLAIYFVISAYIISTATAIATPLTEYGKQSIYSKENAVLTTAVDGIEKWSNENNNGKAPNLLVYYSVYFDEMLGKKANEDVCEQIDWFYDYNVYTYIEFINKHPDESFAIDKSAVDEIMQLYPVEYAKALKGFELSEEIEYKEYKNQKSCDSYIDIYSPIK